MRFALTFLTIALLAAPGLRATSVVPPSFPELVAEADGIYRGRVTSIQARRVPLPEGDGSVIKTFVTFAVERALKGAEQTQLTLEFLGGTVGDETITVSRAVMPARFAHVKRNVVVALSVTVVV